MGRFFERVNQRTTQPLAQPEDVWMATGERCTLERINEKFLELLQRQKEISRDEQLQDPDFARIKNSLTLLG
jgi:hypothetical protein